MRRRHPNKEVEKVLRYAESNGWQVFKRDGHAWGSMRCPQNDADCRCGQFCQMSIWSTPRNPGNHARQLKRKVDGCIHDKGEGNE